MRKKVIFPFIEVLISDKSLSALLKELRGDLCKSGPGYFASEKSFPSNFAQ